MDVSKTWIPYCGLAPQPAELWQRWNFDPYLIFVFAIIIPLVLWLHARPLFKLERPYFLFAAYVLAVILFISPFCALTSALFSARVFHHILLTAVIAPLIVLGLAKPRLLILHTAVIAAVLHAVVFWAWHFPTLYESALTTYFNYWLMQASLAFSAAFLWHSVRAATPPVAILVMLFTTLHMGLLGALLTFATTPLFAPHLFTTEVWGVSSLEDQQLAGVIMWVGGSGIYLVAALAICFRLLHRNVQAAKC